MNQTNETMDELRDELELQLGHQAITELIERLTELNDKPAVFSTAAAVDAVRSFESLVRSHSNFNEEDITLACGVFSVSVFNAATNTNASVDYQN